MRLSAVALACCRWPSLAVCAALLAAGCTHHASTACEPLAAHEGPITLTGLVAAGRHADGAVYAVDKPTDGSYRVFSSEGSELLRRHIAGSGFEREGDVEAFTFQVQEPSPFTLKVEIATGGAIRMGVFRGELDAKSFTIGAQGDVLTVDTGAAQGLTVRNLSGEVTVEYAADLADGRRLVVIRPTDDWDYEDFRLFLGPDDHIEEREVLGVIRYKDGGTTKISYFINGEESLAFFPAPYKTGEPAYLEIGGVRQDLSLQVNWTAATLKYFCF